MALSPVWRALTVVLLSTTVGAQYGPCTTHYPPTKDEAGNDVYTVVDLAYDLNACTMVDMIDRAGLRSFYSQKGPLTLFAPYDLAFEFLPDDIYNKLMSNKTYLQELLLFHTFPGVIGDVNDVYQDELLPSIIPGKNIRLNIYQIKSGSNNKQQVTGRITACGGPIIDGGNCSNGEVRVISNVMHPIPPGSIVDVIDHDPEFTKLKKLVYASKLDEYLKGGPFTFFPPTNAAFDKVPPEVLKEFEDNTTLTRELLTYHLLDWTLYASGGYEGETLVTVQGGKINLTVWYDALWVNGHENARVIYQDYNVYNGVMHIIDNVLIPPLVIKKK
ncbi:transforming growth factor-beta-induced protein ig-h3-like [Diadema antillarum]|uniref:transforming growth factor-beta-induced protein ig-h3-like n=1 Tax=Diadema antillarum TaxID=105358 RepID=UPI003A859E2D